MSTELLHHQVLGSQGEPVLFLNGGMMTQGSWMPIASPLLDRYRVLLCDFRGQLLSPGESHSRLEGNLEDLLAVLDEVGTDRVHVFGTSFGAEVGLLLAARHPERVLSLAAVTAVDRTPPGMLEDSRRMRELAQRIVEGGDRDAFHEALVNGVYSPAHLEAHAERFEERKTQTVMLPTFWYQGLFGILESVGDFDLSAQLEHIQCPTLVIHAAGDALMPEERVRALAAGIDRAEFLVHPSAGHALVAEAPQWVAVRYLDFLARQEA